MTQIRRVQNHPSFIRYGLALAATGLCTGLRWALPDVLRHAPYLGFYPGVVVAAILGGLGPGLVATIASLLLVNFVFVQFDVLNYGLQMRNVIWILGGLGVSLLAERRLNAQRVAEEQRRIAEETASRLNQVGFVTEPILARLPFEEMLRRLLERTADALHADAAVILLLDETTQLLEVRAAIGLDEEVQRQVRIPLGAGIAGRIANSGQLRIIENVREADVFHPILRELSASLMGAPLVVEDRVIGVIHVDSKTPRNFSDSEASLLQVVADRIALTIDRTRSEDRLTHMASFPELNPNPIFETDLDGKITYTNPAARTHFAELSKRGLDDRLLENWDYVRERFITGAEQVIVRNVEAYDAVYQQTLHFPADLNVVRSYLTDITARIKAEEALRDSEAQFRTLANAIPQLCWIANADGWIFWYNDRWYEYTGTTPEQMEGWGWQSVHDPQTLPSVLERWKASIATRQPFDMIFPLRGADGAFRPFLTRIVPVTDSEGRVVHWFGTNTDVSELRDTQEALRASEERWATTLQSIGDAVISTDANGNIVFMNDVAQKLTGWELPEAKEHDLNTVFNIVQEGTRIKPENPASKVIRLGKVVGLANHTVLISRSGVEIPIEDSGAPIRNRDGQIAGVVLVFHDVSEQRNMERAVRMAERLATTGRLAATIAHEIHNPLDTVGNLLFLTQESTKEEQTREYISTASEELTRIAQMTQRMLTFQRESTHPVPVQIPEILDSVLGLYQRKIDSLSIQVDKDIHVSHPLLAQPGELRQVFANLLGNAIEAVGRDHGKIWLRACACHNRRNGRPGIRVVVADNGRGIPADIREKIFEPFFTTKGESGTGLGLWITSDIVRKYNGTMRVRSTTRPERSGTCFSVFFAVEPPITASN